jgi:hypothetical protein
VKVVKFQSLKILTATFGTTLLIRITNRNGKTNKSFKVETMVKKELNKSDQPITFSENVTFVESKVMNGTSVDKNLLAPPLTEDYKKFLQINENNFLKKSANSNISVSTPNQNGPPTLLSVFGAKSQTNKGSKNRGATTDPKKKWPDCQVPYVISSNFTSKDRGIILAAMQRFYADTGIRWIEKPEQKEVPNFVLIDNKIKSCSSTVGKKPEPGWQNLNLGESPYFLLKLKQNLYLMF